MRASRLVVLAFLWLVPVNEVVRADCLDGHLENFSFSGSIMATKDLFCQQTETVNGNVGSVSCPNTCCDKIDCFSCQGPEASYSVSTSANGYTISSHVAVNPSLGTGQGAFALICVDATVVGGEVSCTVDGVQKRLVEGEVEVSTIKGEGVGPSHCLVCAASGVLTPGSVSCSLNVSCVPRVSSSNRSWQNPSGGSYGDAGNWSTNCAPAHDPPQRSDIATFALPGDSFIPVSGPGATAGQWIIRGSPIEFSGSGQVFATSPTDPSLRIFQGGQLRLTGSAVFESVHAGIGTSAASTDSKLEISGAQWTNTESTRVGRGRLDVFDNATASTGALTVGAGVGPGLVSVTGDSSTFDVTGPLVVGDTTPGTLDIVRGTVTTTSPSTAAIIGKTATGTVEVRGGPGSQGGLDVASDLVVGDGAAGRLNIGEGGAVGVGHDLFVSGFGASPAGEVVVDGEGATAILSVGRELVVRANDLAEVVVTDGGVVQAQQLTVGLGQIRPGNAEVTLRGTGGNFGAIGLIVTDTPEDPGPVGVTRVGFTAPGQLNIQNGREASLRGGLRIGLEAQGIVSVSTGSSGPPNVYSKLTVHGETIVGLDSPGFLHLDAAGSMVTNGDLQIGLIPGTPGGSVSLGDICTLQVNGTLAVGAGGIGVLNVLSGSFLSSSRLVVGADAPGATGIITLANQPALTIDGNADLGIGLGRGEIHLVDSTAIMTVNGTMTIGNPSGGTGGGAVTLVGARIEGTGNIVVNPNGSLTGTGTVAVPKINAGGVISPGLSPGTLNIDGDLELLSGGRLEIEYAGTDPGDFDILQVTGAATLGGHLEIQFVGGFFPPNPEAFTATQSGVEADGGMAGDYDLRTYVFPDLFADFDDDGDKDLRDVAAFANCFAESGALGETCQRADWDDDEVIGGREIRELGARLTGPE